MYMSYITKYYIKKIPTLCGISFCLILSHAHSLACYFAAPAAASSNEIESTREMASMPIVTP